MLIVELKSYGDFDMEYTDSVWYSKDYDSLEQAGISKSEFDNDRSVDKAVKKLRKLGFVKMETSKLTVGGNL